jgi:hypothetical protein
MTWVENGIYAAGGDHIPQTWGAFADQTGITAVLHLSGSGPTTFAGRPAARFLWLGLEQEAETDEQARRLAGEFVADCRAQGRRVLLHCTNSRHRTRWVYVAYRLCLGHGLKGVLRDAAQKPWLAPYLTDREAWVAFRSYMKQFRGSLGAESTEDR